MNETTPSVSVSFQVNCPNPYNIMFIDINNEYICNHTKTPDENGNVVVTVDSGLECNERYHFTVTNNETESNSSETFSK